MSVSSPLAAAAPLAVSLALGCGASVEGIRSLTDAEFEAGPPIRLDVPAPFYVPGEQFTWEISVRGIVGGEAVMVVGEPGTAEGRPIVILRSRVESSGMLAFFKEVRDEVTSRVALEGGEPLSHRADIKLGDKEVLVETSFGSGPFEIRYHRLGKGAKTYAQTLPSGHTAHDAHSILGSLRAWNADSGARVYFYVLSGKRVWHVTAERRQPEQIVTRLGTFEAIRVDAVAWRLERDMQVDRDKDPRSFSLWLSDDMSRMPLRVTGDTEYGEIRVELVDYQRPEATITVTD